MADKFIVLGDTMLNLSEIAIVELLNRDIRFCLKNGNRHGLYTAESIADAREIYKCLVELLSASDVLAFDAQVP